MAVYLVFINLLFAGLLAGEEFAIRYGVRAPLANLDQRAHILLRQALIRSLRILVPIIFGVTLLSGIAATIVSGGGAPITLGSGLRAAGLLALLTFFSITLFGTVPINQAAVAWDPDAPPKNWQALIKRWERLDTARCWAALTAFALFLAALTPQ